MEKELKEWERGNEEFVNEHVVKGSSPLSFGLSLPLQLLLGPVTHSIGLPCMSHKPRVMEPTLC